MFLLELKWLKICKFYMTEVTWRKARFPKKSKIILFIISQWTNPFQWNLLVRVTLAQKPVMSFNDFYSLKPLTYLKMVHTNFFHGVLKNVFICFIYYKFFSRSHSFKWKRPLYFTQSSRILLDKASLTWSDKRKK